MQLQNHRYTNPVLDRLASQDPALTFALLSREWAPQKEAEKGKGGGGIRVEELIS